MSFEGPFDFMWPLIGISYLWPLLHNGNLDNPTNIPSEHHKGSGNCGARQQAIDEQNLILRREVETLQAKLWEAETDRAALRAALQTTDFDDTRNIVQEFSQINSGIADWSNETSENIMKFVSAAEVEMPAPSYIHEFLQSKCRNRMPELGSDSQFDFENLLYVLLSQTLAEELDIQIFQPLHPSIQPKVNQVLQKLHNSVRKHGEHLNVSHSDPSCI